MKIIKFFFGGFAGLLALIFIFSYWLSSEYNTEFPPPETKTTLAEIFMPEFQGQQKKIEKLQLDPSKYVGFVTSYGNKAKISLIRSRSFEMSNEYFKSKVVPVIDKFPNHSRAQVNGRWFAKGSDKSGDHWYGWVNKDVVFILQADSKQTLDELVDAFPYISH